MYFYSQVSVQTRKYSLYLHNHEETELISSFLFSQQIYTYH